MLKLQIQSFGFSCTLWDSSFNTDSLNLLGQQLLFNFCLIWSRNLSWTLHLTVTDFCLPPVTELVHTNLFPHRSWMPRSFWAWARSSMVPLLLGFCFIFLFLLILLLKFLSPSNFKMIFSPNLPLRHGKAHWLTHIIEKRHVDAGCFSVYMWTGDNLKLCFFIHNWRESPVTNHFVLFSGWLNVCIYIHILMTLSNTQ